jgi:ATP-binding cassette, subfamily B, bacterial PglK
MKKNVLYRTFRLIPEQHIKKGITTVSLLTFSALLDLFSLATFLPLIILIIKPDQLTKNHHLAKLYSLAGLSNPAHFGVALTITALAFILIKTQINIWVTRKKARFGYTIASDLATTLLTNYLYWPYHAHANANYSKELNRITNLPLTFANNLVIPMGTIMSELFITTILLTGIAIHDIRLFSFLATLALPTILLYKRKRKGIKHTSQQIKHTYPLLLKYSLEGIEGVNEIKSFQKESYFRNRFKDVMDRLGQIFAEDHTRINSVSRLTEFIAAVIIGLLIVYVLIYYPSKEDALLLLSIYAGVSFRIIPSINRIFAAFMQIRTHEFVTEELSVNMQPSADHSRLVTEVDHHQLHFSDKIELKNIHFAYEGQPAILSDTNLTICKGEKIILTGRSGNGKTTLLLLLMRFLKPQGGEFMVNGKALEDSESRAFQRLIGYVPQSPYILDASIRENMAFGVPDKSIDVEKLNKIVVDLDLHDWIYSLPEKLNTRIGEKGTKVSGGQRQRLAIARALYHDAEILLLDEITNQLDRKSEQEVLNAIQKLAERNKTIVFITHRQELWPLFDVVYELKDGEMTKMLAPATN